MFLPELKSVNTIIKHAVFYCEIDLGGHILTGQGMQSLSLPASMRPLRRLAFFDGRDKFVTAYLPDASERHSHPMILMVSAGDEPTTLIDAVNGKYTNLYVCDIAMLMAEDGACLSHDAVIKSGKSFVQRMYSAIEKLCAPTPQDGSSSLSGDLISA